MATIMTCRYNCVCNNDKCEFKHFINYKQRVALFEFSNEKEELKQLKKEDFAMIRKKPCIYGQLCNNEDCTFKHGYNFEGRKLFIEKFGEIKETTKPKEIKKVCNKNCLCQDEGCKFMHFISPKQRKVLLAAIGDDIEKDNEDTPEIRKKMCVFGQLCNKEDCKFNHGYNFESRKKIIEAFKKK